jgi:hypothetical protein
LFAGAQGHFNGIGIVERPRHGTLFPRVGVGITYRSALGYRGEDSFAIAVRGEAPAGNGTATIRVRVSVK